LIPIELRYKDVEIRREYNSDGKLMREILIQDGERLLIPIADGDYFHELRETRTLNTDTDSTTDNGEWNIV